MFWPLLLSDAKRNRIGKKILWWTGIMVDTLLALFAVFSGDDRRARPLRNVQIVTKGNACSDD